MPPPVLLEPRPQAGGCRARCQEQIMNVLLQFDLVWTVFGFCRRLRSLRRRRRMSHRPTIHGTRHAISAGHYLAAAAGFSILEGGGNAIDAGVAAGIALGVLQPGLVNFAGVAPIILRLADGTVESIAGLGRWPKAIPADLFMRDHNGTIPDGVLRTVVPAAPDAWITALRRHGTMRFVDVAAPAIRFAE